MSFKSSLFCERVLDAPLSLILISLLVFASCSSGTKSSDSILIQKVKAVQHQMMVQGNITDEERQYILSLVELVGEGGAQKEGRISIDEVDRAPSFPGCENSSPLELKECFKEGIASFVDDHFNTKIFSDLEIENPEELDVFIIVDKYGKIKHHKVRVADVLIQAEVVRVNKLIPDVIPAKHNGQDVEVIYMYTLPYGGK